MHQRRIFYTIFLTIFVVMLGVGIIAPTMPLYADQLGANGLWLGIIYAAFSLSRLVFMPMAGKFSDKKGRKNFLAIGLATYAIVSLGYIWSATVLELTWIRFLHGLGSAMVIPIAAAVIGDISPKGREGEMMGNFQIALFLGFGAGPLIGGVVMDYWGITTVFILMGGLSFLALLLILLFLPRIVPTYSEKQKRISSFREMWHHSCFRGLLGFRVTNAVGRATVIVFIPIFADKLHISPAQIGLLVSINMIVTSVLQPYFGKLADKLSRPMLICVGNALGALSLGLMIISTDVWQLLFFSILMGFGSAVAFPAAGAVATGLGREHGMGNVMGYFNMGMSIGSIIGSLFSGWIMDLFGMIYVFIFGAVVGVGGSLLAWFWFHKDDDYSNEKGS